MFRCLLFAGLVALAPAAAPRTAAQDGEKTVRLRWYGQSMFQLETSTGKLVVFDPHAIPAFAPPRLTADVTLISHPHNDHNVVEQLKEAGRVFEAVVTSKDGRRTEWNPVDERVGPLRIRNLGTYHDPFNGMQRGKNGVWIVEADGLTFVHLGDLGHELSEAQVRAIGPVDVLMVPVGGIYTLNGEQAQAVVAQLKPRLYVLPMHYGTRDFDELLGADEFLDGFKKNFKKMTTTNELVIPVGLKAETFTVVQLGWAKPTAKDTAKEPARK